MTISAKIKIALIEDEERSLRMLRNLLNEHAPEVEIVAEANSVATGIAAIQRSKPDLVLLDITMPDGDGFEVLEKTSSLPYEVVFTTAHNEFAVRAFELAALHYLLKPVNVEELLTIIQRYRQKKSSSEERISIAQDALRNTLQKIVLPSLEGLVFVALSDIIRLEADGNYSLFFLKDKRTLLISKPLHHYEQQLAPENFFRVHDKHLVNLEQVKKYVKGRGGYVVMQDDTRVDVSARRKELFLKAITRHA